MDLKGFTVAIKCECNPCHEWMAFASWYSIKKRIPDYNVLLELNLTKPLFRWANRLGVRISKKCNADFKIEPTVIAARDFYGNMEISSSKSNNQTTFVDYKDGCGNFVVDEWINNSKVPFFRAVRRFGNGNLTVNEMAILTVWEQCHHVYLSAGGA
jgi:hypothetical protein